MVGDIAEVEAEITYTTARSLQVTASVYAMNPGISLYIESSVQLDTVHFGAILSRINVVKILLNRSSYYTDRLYTDD